MNLELTLRELLRLSTSSLTNLRWFRWVWSKAFTGSSMCHWYHLILEEFLLVGFGALQALPACWVCIFRYARLPILGFSCCFSFVPRRGDHIFADGVGRGTYRRRYLVAIIHTFFWGCRCLTRFRVLHQFRLQGQHGDLMRHITIRCRNAWTTVIINQITDIGVISVFPFWT